MVLDIRSPAPTAESPFTGSVHFDRTVYLPPKPGIRLAGAQSYRNMRAHMVRLENSPMVSRFHSLEQSVERHNQGSFDNLLSHLYGALSDYGSSTIRPFVWFIALLALTFAIIFFSDGATPSPAAELRGWQSTLSGTDTSACAERALILMLNATLNPLAMFGTAGLLIAKRGWLTAWLAVHGLFSAVLVVLFILALRRRFKIT